MGALVQEIQENHGFELVDEDLSGAMHEASKRRRDETPDQAQIPVLPLAKGVSKCEPASHTDAVKLPEGIE